MALTPRMLLDTAHYGSNISGLTRCEDGTGMPGLRCGTSTGGYSECLFQAGPSTASFSVPPSAPFIEELQRCWADPRHFSHIPSDLWALASIQDAVSHGLDRMPCIEPALAALILSPEEALRPDSCFPRSHWCLTDKLNGKSYDSAAWVVSIGNSMSPLILALSQTVQSSGADQGPSLCKEISTGIIWSKFLLYVRILTAAFCTS